MKIALLNLLQPCKIEVILAYHPALLLPLSSPVTTSKTKKVV